MKQHFGIFCNSRASETLTSEDSIAKAKTAQCVHSTLVAISNVRIMSNYESQLFTCACAEDQGSLLDHVQVVLYI